MTETDQIVKYVRLNLSGIKALLQRPDAAKAITRKLKDECPKGELAELLAPIIIQRAQNTIQESGMKRALEALLKTHPALTKEREFQEEQKQKQPQLVQRVRVGSQIPWSLSNFRDEQTNQAAAEWYDRYARMFPGNVGKAIAMVRRDLNRSDLDLTPAAPRERRFEPLPSKPKPVRQPEYDSLFSRDEIKYAGKTAQRVFHGGRAFDRLSEESVGTGEGSMFGWGFYFTQTLASAETYASMAPDGRVYSATIPEDEKFLLWDEPGMGSHYVWERVQKLAPRCELTGKEFYYHISKERGGDKAASKFLRSLGIMGIRYPSSLFGGPPYSYVLFDANDARDFKPVTRRTASKLFQPPMPEKARVFKRQDGSTTGLVV